ncbi:MAG: Fic family protein [Nanoarchaeota archaeon]
MRIITKKKGSKIYFYLQHSLRKGDRVITKEKYLGTEVPKDIDNLILQFKKEVQEGINKKLELIKKNFQSEWKKIPESARERELEEISIAFTYNTNAIEGSTITLDDAREIIKNNLSPNNKSLRDVKETEFHNKVFLQMLKKDEKITKELLFKWHKGVFGETKSDIAGKFRDYLVRVGPHLAPDWQDIENLMKDFIEFLNEDGKMNPVELAGRAHYKFEKIHPFGDGNGRIGRLLMNFILWHEKYPMLIIEYKKRKSYYKALQKDEEHFVNYFIRRYLTVHKKRYLKNSTL